MSENAYLQYVKSRSNASADSNKRIKDIEFAMCRTHPVFKKDENLIRKTTLNLEDEKQTIIEKMKNYRPKGVRTLVFHLISHFY